MRFRATAIQLATAAERYITIEPHAVAMPRSPDSCWTNSGTGQLFGAEHVLRAPHAQPWQRDVDLRVENAATVKVEPGRAIPAGERPSTPRGRRHKAGRKSAFPFRTGALLIGRISRWSMPPSLFTRRFVHAAKTTTSAWSLATDRSAAPPRSPRRFTSSDTTAAPARPPIGWGWRTSR